MSDKRPSRKTELLEALMAGGVVGVGGGMALGLMGALAVGVVLPVAGAIFGAGLFAGGAASFFSGAAGFVAGLFLVKPVARVVFVTTTATMAVASAGIGLAVGVGMNILDRVRPSRAEGSAKTIPAEVNGTASSTVPETCRSGFQKSASARSGDATVFEASSGQERKDQPKPPL